MGQDTLFAKETAVIATAEGVLERAREKDDPLPLPAFTKLLQAYKKLCNTSRRLVRLSDRNERDLRKATEELRLKNRELEMLSVKLSKYLSPQVYESIFTEDGKDVNLRSTRRKLTVFFSDIVGFTEMTERLEAEDLTAVINRYFTEMSAIALRHGATIDKFIGDGLMIFFGDPQTRGVREDAVACLRMAIEMRARLEQLREVWSELGLNEPIACRMGMHTGYCTVGNFGSVDRMDYTILGVPVNLASRLEGQATPDQILISADTYAQVREAVVCEEVGALTVKGVPYPVHTYEAVGLKAAPDPSEAPFEAASTYASVRVDPSSMSAEERAQAAQMLREALGRLEGAPCDVAAQ